MERKAKIKKRSNKYASYGSIEKFQNSWNFRSEHSVPKTLPGLNKIENAETNASITNEQVEELINRINTKFIPGNKNLKFSDKDEYFAQIQKLFITFAEEKTNFFVTLKNYIILVALIIFPSKKLAAILLNGNK